jgi:hypothetical protein
MSEGKIERSFHRYSQVMGIISGISFALFVSVFMGDYGFGIDIPTGAAGLWITTTVYSIQVGLRLALGSRWDEIDFQDRRRVAVRYLLVGFVNLISMGLFNLSTTGSYEGFIFAAVYGAMLIYAFSRLFESERRDQENDDLFP